MHEYFRYFRSDLYKLEAFLVLSGYILFFPVCGAVLMLLYAKISNSKDLNKLAAFCRSSPWLILLSFRLYAR